MQTQFRRLTTSCLNTALNFSRSFFVKSQPLWFQCTTILNAEPLKKKKRVDPQILKERAEKKVRRIQRDIKRLEKVAKQYKPISELELPKKVLRDSERVRPPALLTDAELQDRAILRREWAVYKRKQHLSEMCALRGIVTAQEKALDALQETSPELYEEALAIDLSLIPLKMQGPVETPSIENYNYPDGDFFDITKVYKPIVPSDPVKQRQLGLHLKKK